MKKLFTSESVTSGHPDKVCDQISDAILDAILEQDPHGRVACEVTATTGIITVMGEITTKAYVDIPSIVRKTLIDIGYDSPEAGFDGHTCAVNVMIDEQSPDIALGTNDRVGGAGDQGMMFGFACDETPQLMPLPIMMAHDMAALLEINRKSGFIPMLLPDGKTQATIEYDDVGRVLGIDTVVVSTQHKHCNRNEMDELKELICNYIVKSTCEEYRYANKVPRILINPTGLFLNGGPAADTGLTGRKIIVDTYGGYARHGGGAFSGKDPTKVDRSGAYMARHIAKTIVAAGLANKCEIQLAYAIGVPEPVSILIDMWWREDSGLLQPYSYSYKEKSTQQILNAITKTFDLTPQGIIAYFDLRRPIYKDTASYGHFGRDEFPWEQVGDSVKALQKNL